MLAVIVEDEWSIRMQIADTLVDAGWERDIALLIADIRLTGTLIGWDVTDAYRNANAAMKILYCSGKRRPKFSAATRQIFTHSFRASSAMRELQLWSQIGIRSLAYLGFLLFNRR